MMDSGVDLFRDNVWTFIGALVTVLGIIISIIIYLRQKQKKELSYELVTDTQLLSLNAETKGVVEIFYNKTPVKNVHLQEIAFSNTGNTPINIVDFDRPISISFKDSTNILSADISISDPKNLNAKIENSTQKILIHPVLLNPKDTFTIKMLLSDYSSRGHVEGRISGVRKIMNKQEFVPMLSILGLLCVTAAIAYLSINVFPKKPNTFPNEMMELAVGVLIFGYAAALKGFSSSPKMRDALIRTISRFLNF